MSEEGVTQELCVEEELEETFSCLVDQIPITPASTAESSPYPKKSCSVPAPFTEDLEQNPLLHIFATSVVTVVRKPVSKSYNCAYCEQTFLTPQKLGGHMAKVHPGLSQ